MLIATKLHVLTTRAHHCVAEFWCACWCDIHVFVWCVRHVPSPCVRIAVCSFSASQVYVLVCSWCQSPQIRFLQLTLSATDLLTERKHSMFECSLAVLGLHLCFCCSCSKRLSDAVFWIVSCWKFDSLIVHMHIRALHDADAFLRIFGVCSRLYTILIATKKRLLLECVRYWVVVFWNVRWCSTYVFV